MIPLIAPVLEGLQRHYLHFLQISPTHPLMDMTKKNMFRFVYVRFAKASTKIVIDEV